VHGENWGGQGEGEEGGRGARAAVGIECGWVLQPRMYTLYDDDYCTIILVLYDLL